MLGVAAGSTLPSSAFPVALRENVSLPLCSHNPPRYLSKDSKVPPRGAVGVAWRAGWSTLLHRWGLQIRIIIQNNRDREPRNESRPEAVWANISWSIGPSPNLAMLSFFLSGVSCMLIGRCCLSGGQNRNLFYGNAAAGGQSGPYGSASGGQSGS